MRQEAYVRQADSEHRDCEYYVKDRRKYMFDKLDDLLIRYEEIMNELAEPGVTDNP